MTVKLTEAALRRMVRSEILREAGEQLPGGSTTGAGVPGNYAFRIKYFTKWPGYYDVRVYSGTPRADHLGHGMAAGIIIDNSSADTSGLDGAWEIKSMGYDNAPHSLRVFLWTLGIEIASLVGKGAVAEHGLYADDVSDEDLWRLFMNGESGAQKITLKDNPWEKDSIYRYRYIIRRPSALIQLKNSGQLTADSDMPPGI